jgi:hypothetical protein
VPAHMHPARFWFACWLDISWNIVSPGSTSRHESTQCPPCTESPFAPSGCYPSGGGLSGHLERYYPSLIAHTGSCARPTPSYLLRPWPRSVGPCRLLPAPAGRWPFPTLSPQVFPRVPGPLPRWALWCIRPFLPMEQRPSPHIYWVGSHNEPYSDFTTGVYFGAAVIPSCSGPQACSPPRSLLPQPYHQDWAAVTFTSEHLTARCLTVPRIC